MRLGRTTALILSLAVGLALPASFQTAYADSNQAYLLGTVTDSGGHPLAGYSVGIYWCPSTSTASMPTTDPQGCVGSDTPDYEGDVIDNKTYLDSAATDRAGHYAIGLEKNEVLRRQQSGGGKWTVGRIYDEATQTYLFQDVTPAVGSNVSVGNFAIGLYDSTAPTTGVALTGAVTDAAGQPVRDMVVLAYGADGAIIDGTSTLADGHYYFTVPDPADPGSAGATFVSGSVKLLASSDDYRNDGFVEEWTGGTRAKSKAALVPVAAYGQPAATAPTIALDKLGTISGSVSLPTAGGNWSAHAQVLDLDGKSVGSSPTDATGAFHVDVAPGTYYVRAEGSQLTEYASPSPDCSACTGVDFINYVAGYYGKSAFSLATATPITVAADGSASVGTIVLGNALKNLEKPVVKGKLGKNKVLSVTPGVWNHNADVTYTYTWKIGKKEIATGQTLKLTKKLWKKVGKSPAKLTLVVTASDVYGELVDGSVTLKVAKSLSKGGAKGKKTGGKPKKPKKK